MDYSEFAVVAQVVAVAALAAQSGIGETGEAAGAVALTRVKVVTHGAHHGELVARAVGQRAPEHPVRLTLAVDIGGTGIKFAALDDKGRIVGDPARVPTPPKPVAPEQVVAIVEETSGKLGAFAVAIRSALLDARGAWLYAGAGIVRGSEPALEYVETRVKQSAMLTALAGSAP